MSDQIELQEIRQRNVRPSAPPKSNQKQLERVATAPEAPFTSLNPPPFTWTLQGIRHWQELRTLIIGGMILGLLAYYLIGYGFPPEEIAKTGFLNSLRYSFATNDSTNVFLMGLGLLAAFSCFSCFHLAGAIIQDSVFLWPSLTWKMIGSIVLEGELKLLDVNCGSGLTTIMLSKAAEIEKASLRITALDKFDRTTTSHATISSFTKNIKNKVENVEVIPWKLDIGAPKLPFSDNSFDLVVGNLAINSLTDQVMDFTPPPSNNLIISNSNRSPQCQHFQSKLLREFVRVLKPKGRLLLLDEVELAALLGQYRASNIQITHEQVGFGGWNIGVIQATKVA